MVYAFLSAPVALVPDAGMRGARVSGLLGIHLVLLCLANAPSAHSLPCGCHSLF